MIDIELFAEGRLREREIYFASPQYKARASWRKQLASLAGRKPRMQRAPRLVEQTEPVSVY